jgi:hypothetical protein
MEWEWAIKLAAGLLLAGAFLPIRSTIARRRLLNAVAHTKCLKSLWWAFLDTYRTLCLAPSPQIREIFEQLREDRHLASPLTAHNDTA